MDKKVVLPESEIPKYWYNCLPDLPKPLPPVINPATLKPITPDDLAPIFPMGLIEQEVSQERWIKIPEEVLEKYLLYRPTPLHRAYKFEKALGTKARIYFKNESVSPPGSHKPNTAIAQAYYNAKEGVKRLTTETGAGQWGSALAFATCLFGLKCTIYMVKISYEQKPYRRILAQSWGAEMVPSPSNRTKFGRKILEDDPECLGSLGIAISEAVEDAATHEDTKYSLGSVLNHVLLHQTIVGLETMKQLEMIGEKPSVLIGCVGGGSNFGGFFLPFLPRKLEGEDIRFLAVEPKACPTLTKGLYKYDFGDTACTTPLLKMFTLGHDFVPPPIHAGGLRYHGDAPILCHLYDMGIVEAVAYHQREVFEAALLFARTEGLLPAPETAHAIKAVVEEAKDAPEGKVIVYNHSGHGYFDLSAYQAYFEGKLEDYEYPEEKIKESLAKLPKVE
ncbi:MAG TPA: TrpB-like pyridoxal phosphate-dependent enzyme [bacterium]|nr:TrpB-like pyridoxal phosphate-dependent enzyme [bacterium]HEX68406.1 TrpB-like pyridoxal phosphate-dependent enzyme [bacterium]